MNNVKKLPVVYPPITSYMSHAPILSIISDTEEYLPWFIYNYIQIREADDGIDFSFVSPYCPDVGTFCPHIELISMKKDFVNKFVNLDVVEFLVKCVEEDYYIIAGIDMYYISNYDCYKKSHILHPIFIYGYDHNKKDFCVADFFNNKKYEFSKTPFDELKEAYLVCDKSQFTTFDIQLIKRKPYNHFFRIHDFSYILERYLTGNETSVIYMDALKGYGLEVFYNIVSSHVANFTNFQEYDKRILPIFCDHKRVLKIAAEYLVNNGAQQLNCLLPMYDELYNHCITYRNLLLKYELMNKNNMFKYEKLYDIKSKEINLLKKTIDLIRR